MKNINKYHGPFDKMNAHAAWCFAHRSECVHAGMDGMCDYHRRAMCFNAWLHSSNGDRKKGFDKLHVE